MASALDEEDEEQAFAQDLLDFFVDSIGATLTDINDAELKCEKNFLLTLMINDYYITKREMLLEDVISTSELVHWHTLGKGV